jgi:hypothetical protein
MGGESWKEFQRCCYLSPRNRKEREKQRPIRYLFGMDMDVKASEKGAVLEIEVGKLGITE